MAKTPRPLLDLLALSDLALPSDALSKLAADVAGTRFRIAMRKVRGSLSKDTFPREGDGASEAEKALALALARALSALEACAALSNGNESEEA
jgi:hypothetical protein